jgi:hypothetical protein
LRGGWGFQLAIPAIYAWAVTVAPCAFARAAHPFAGVTAVLALAGFGIAVVVELRGGARARPFGIWSFVALSVATWCIAPAGLGPAKLDVLRALLGMLGWFLFGAAAAAPPLAARPEMEERIVRATDLRPRSASHRLDAAYLAIACLLAFALQIPGWGQLSAERGVLVRLAGIALGVAVTGTAAQLVLAKYGKRRQRSNGSSLRTAGPAIAFVLLVTGVGLLLRLS